MSFGRQVGYTTGQPIQVRAGGNMDWKPAGVTVDWATVPPVAADTTLIDLNVLKAGQSGIQYGTILCKIAATGKFGPFTSTNAGTTVASGGTVIGVSTLTLASGANINPGDSLQIDTAGQAETLVVASVSGAVVTFTSPTTKTHAAGVAVAKADDGRQTLRRGECFILNQTVFQNVPFGIGSTASNHPGVFDGGLVWKDRLQVQGFAAATLANAQPTLAAFEAAFPRIAYVEN